MTTTAPEPARPPLPQALAGSTAVLIGGTAGIGLATGELLGSLGVRVVLAGRDEARLDAAVRRVRAVATAGADAVTGVAADARDEKALEALFDRVGKVDHVLLTAGGRQGAGQLGDLTRDTVLEAFDMRIAAALATARAAVPRLAPGGSITFSSGVLVTRPIPGMAAPLAAVGGIETLTRALAVELAPQGLRVNTVRFGLIDTSLSSEISSGFTIPLGRVGTPAEAASAVLFMMTNTYVTGEVLTVDGGFSVG